MEHVIVHDYINASEQPGQFAAEHCNRQAVTVRWLLANPDVPAWDFDAELEEMGLDPWRMIDGVDAWMNGEFVDIWWADSSRREKKVPMDYVVYVSRKNFAVPPEGRRFSKYAKRNPDGSPIL